ncbi:MAG: transposase, partial [Sedimenticola sp.]
HLKVAEARRMRLYFQKLFTQSGRISGETLLKKWSYWATHSCLEPKIKVAETVKVHWDGILSWFDSHLTTGFVEGMSRLDPSS